MKKTIVVVAFLCVCSCTVRSPPKITLAWDPNPEKGVVGYNVYRSETPGCCYKKITSDPIAQPQYTDTSVRPGQRYYYRITTVNSKGEESGFSDEISAEPKE